MGLGVIAKRWPYQYEPHSMLKTQHSKEHTAQIAISASRFYELPISNIVSHPSQNQSGAPNQSGVVKSPLRGSKWCS